MRLELFDVRRRLPRQRTQRDDERRFREQRDPFFSVLFCSIRRPYITFKLQRRDKDTPLRLRNFSDIRAIGMCHFRSFGMACVIVVERK